MRNIIVRDEIYKYIIKIWLDVDDTIYDSSPLIQFYVDRYFPIYNHQNLEAKQRTLALWKYYYAYMEGLLNEARKFGNNPDMSLFNRVMYPQGQDDIIRTTVRQKYESIVDDKNFRLYQEPLLIIGQSIQDAQNDLDWFYELRTAQLEADGKSDHGDIPYELIYRKENLLPYAEENLIALYKRFGSLVAGLTAHNGPTDTTGREFEAKIEGLRSIVSNLEVRGIRFKPKPFDIHSGEIRDRSLKSTVMRAEFGLSPDEPITGQLEADDSLFNANDVYREGGIPIWIIPKNICDRKTAEILNRNNYTSNFDANDKNSYFAMARSIREESLCREFDELHLDGPDDKVLRKRIAA